MGKEKKIIFRADGSSKIGLGHLIRSSALADVLKEEYTCILVTRCKIPSLLQTLKSTFTEIIQLPENDYQTETQTITKGLSNSELIILDGYFFDEAYQKNLADLGFSFICTDNL